MNRGFALSRAELIRTLTAYTGIATADGAGGGTTIIDTALKGKNDFITGKTVLIMSGDASFEDKGAASFNPATGVITLASGFSAKIVKGTIYRVVNISSVEIAIANTEAAVEALLVSSGLVHRAAVTEVPNATTFRAAELIGYGSTYFRNWIVYVVWDAAGLGDAPQDECKPITAFNSADATFTHAAFTSPLAVGDKVLLLHPWIARIANLTRPQKGTQATTNVLTVVGAAIEGTVPFKVSGLLSLHNMQAGDTFLVTEEIRDQDDTNYREYARTSYSDVQTSPMVWFEEKVCQGWRVRIQMVGGGDRDVTYQFFRERQSA